MKTDKVSLVNPSITSAAATTTTTKRNQTSSHGRTTGPTRRSTKGQWTPEEDEILCRAVERFHGKNWKKIAECFKDRTDVQCLHRWQKVLNPELVKGPWSKEEDETIVQMVDKYGPKKWSTIAQHLPGRIGKQCRERWHNHLNPSINKEAWTQEEELALIRAHQIYGNRWAELTKYLPGRTDNSIKNHWNSSVKKKLDSYIASGLLEQFQGLPLIQNQIQSTPSSSLRIQSSGDDKIEEISECSQESSAIPCSQSANELAMVVVNETEEFQWAEEPLSCVRPENSSPASSSAQYYTALEDITYSMREIPRQVSCPSRFVEHNLPHDPGSMDYQFTNVQDCHDISLLEELGQESSGLPPVEVNVQTSSMGNSPDEQNPILISDEECCRLLFSQTTNNGISDANIQMLQAEGNSASCGQTFDGGTLIYCTGPNQVDNPSFGTRDQQYIMTSAQDNIIYANESENSPCTDTMDNSDLQELAYLPNESSKLVPLNSFNSRSASGQACSSVDCKPDEHTENQDSGTLCYEPPRFPSLDIPFFSCDLVQSGNDSQQEYSPLGIRQLMMSSMNCITPFRLWDSPTRDKSPDALLKSAAKTFTATPSILKKRNRDFLLSPLSDRRIDKKLETEMTSSLAKDFSRLDVMFDDNGIQNLSPANQKGNYVSSVKDKENLTQGQQKEEHGPCEKTVDNGASPDKTKEETVGTVAKMKVNEDEASKTIQESSGVLVEQNMNKLLLVSPDQVRFREDKTPRNHKYKSFGCLNHGVTGNDKESHLVVSVPSSALLENTAVFTGNDSTNANFGVFGETPFKRSIDSPSAWKSPWFINSFVPGPRVDTELTVEDMGYFLSPGGDRSFDALGLMKQLSEHTASAYADAAEVMGSETPDTILKEKRRQSLEHENKNISECHGRHSQSSPNVMTECRVLDFSDCGTPGKVVENGKYLAGASLSSPSSYLLKSCR